MRRRAAESFGDSPVFIHLHGACTVEQAASLSMKASTSATECFRSNRPSLCAYRSRSLVSTRDSFRVHRVHRVHIKFVPETRSCSTIFCVNLIDSLCGQIVATLLGRISESLLWLLSLRYGVALINSDIAEYWGLLGRRSEVLAAMRASLQSAPIQSALTGSQATNRFRVSVVRVAIHSHSLERCQVTCLVTCRVLAA